MLSFLASVWTGPSELSLAMGNGKGPTHVSQSSDSDGEELRSSEIVYSEDDLHGMPGTMPQRGSVHRSGRQPLTSQDSWKEGLSSGGSADTLLPPLQLVDRGVPRPPSHPPPTTAPDIVQDPPRMDVDTTTSAGLTIPLAHTSTSIPGPPVISCSSSPNNLPASQKLQRDEELWYPDGNIILIAREIEFRLYQGPLMEHSRVFQDMLTMPQPPPSDTQPSSAASPACVTIHLDDSPEDLRHFLRVFVGKSFLYGGFHPAYHEISACIRLADKYECTMLMQRSLEYLKRYFHDNFDAWKDDAAVFAPPKFERPHCIGVVNLARLTGQDKMLPGALMACCQLGAEIADGFPREDGSPDGARETLSAADLARCFVGRAKLLEWNARATLRILHQEVHAECRQREQCGAVLLRMLRALEDSSVLYSLRWDWSWMPWLDKEDPERELCGACYGMLGKNGRQKEQQRIIFDQLPALMQVEVKHWGKTDEEIARIEAEEAEAAAAAAAAAAASGDQGQDQMNTHGVVNDNDDDDEDSSDNEDSDSDEESDGSDA